MYIHVNGKNIEITDAIKAYVKEKLGKVTTHYDQITGMDVILSVIKNPAATGKHVAEVSCKTTTGVTNSTDKLKSLKTNLCILTKRQFATQKQKKRLKRL